MPRHHFHDEELPPPLEHTPPFATAMPAKPEYYAPHSEVPSSNSPVASLCAHVKGAYMKLGGPHVKAAYSYLH